MAAQNFYLGASFPVVAAMPAPNRWRRTRVKKGVVNEAADGTAYAHLFSNKWQWQGEWIEISLANMTTIITEYNRSRSLALVDFDSTSWTVIAKLEGIEVELAPGTNPPLYNVRVAFQER